MPQFPKHERRKKREGGKERKPGIVSLSVLRGRREGGRVRIDRATAFAFRGEIPPLSSLPS